MPNKIIIMIGMGVVVTVVIMILKKKKEHRISHYEVTSAINRDREKGS